MSRTTAATALLVGVGSLAYELVQVRMLAFLLGGSMDFLAIPLALLGLAIGSVVCHYGWKGDLRELISRCARWLFPVTALSLLAVFGAFDLLFPEVQAFRGYADPWGEAGRVLVYSAAFLPPYVLFGAMLAALFTANAERMGQLYFFDLAGAGLGCVLTPTMLTLTDLPETLIAVLLVTVLLGAVHARTESRLWTGLPLVAFLVVALLAQQRVVFREHPDATVLASAALKNEIAEGQRIREVDVRWNEIARTSLVRGEGRAFSIVQDNGLSNVTVFRWKPEFRGTLDPARVGHRGLAWSLGLDPQRVLVMFAGTGRDMVTFDLLAGGEAEIVGVELNPDVVGMATDGTLDAFGLSDFVSQPGIDLVRSEGREFLNGDERRWDLIHVANNGAVHAVRTGHTRKFLDTEEALAAYLHRLDPDGMLVFATQPIAHKIAPLGPLLEGLTDLPAGDCIVVWGDPHNPDLDSIAIKPSGFTRDDVAKVAAMVRQVGMGHRLLYSPFGRGVPRVADLVAGTVVLDRVTDDRPFTRRLGLSDLPLFPDSVPEPWVLSTWIKVFTIVVFTGVAGGVAGLAVLAGGRAARVPPGWALFLLASGVGYMCVEIGLIARTELILGNPLYSVAINLALFLFSNAIGAAIADRWAPLDSPLLLAVGTLVGVAWGLVVIEVAAATLLSAPLVIKVLGVAVATAPVGMVLGMFYPWCVTQLAQSGRGASVPITYGLTTLSSVLGSSLAMTAIIDLGFTRVIGIGAVAYGVAALAAWRAQRMQASTGVLRR